MSKRHWARHVTGQSLTVYEPKLAWETDYAAEESELAAPPVRREIFVDWLMCEYCAERMRTSKWARLSSGAHIAHRYDRQLSRRRRRETCQGCGLGDATHTVGVLIQDF